MRMLRSKGPLVGIRQLLPTFAALLLLAGSATLVPAQGGGQVAQTTGTTGAPQTTGTTGAQTTGAQTTGTQTTGAQTTGTTGVQTTGAQTTGTTGATTGSATTGAQTTGAATTGATTGTATAGQATTGTATPPVAPAPLLGTNLATVGLAQNVALPTYGASYFAEARAAVDARRKEGAANPGSLPQTNPLQGPVGPDNRVNINIPVPERYQLGPGDSLKIRYASPVMAATVADVTVDQLGSIIVPGTSEKLTVRGQTLAQARDQIRSVMRGYFRDVTVEVTLGELRTFTIRVLGDAYAPGTYEVPSIITLYNAIYAAGGPAERGSYRSIQVKRLNGTTKNVDLYRLLQNGDSTLDIPLQAGDVIMFPPAGTQVAVRGEVRRAAVYELLPGEKLANAIAYAGGIKPSGVAQKVAVESVRPGSARIQIDANLSGKGPQDNPTLYDGDIVEVFSIRPVLVNAVTIAGAVDQPRTYAFTKGMTVADLLEDARGLLPDAALDRAEVLRLNPDGSRTIIPFNLAAAARRVPSENKVLLVNDQVVVYHLNEVQFLGTNMVTVHGAVQREGQYYRPTGMTVRDLLMRTGGLMPNANGQGAILLRQNDDGTPGPLVRLNLMQALKGDPNNNLVLKDNDTLTVMTVAQSSFVPNQTVTVSGAVQREGEYPRAQGMHVSDLVALAGGPIGKANTKQAFLQRVNIDGTQGPLLYIDLDKAAAGDPTNNVELQPQDKLSVFTLEQTQYQVPQTVNVQGAVQRPGLFASSTNMTLKDIIALAGGTQPNASDTLEITKAWAPVGTPVTRIKVADALAGTGEGAYKLQAGDTITIPRRSDLMEHPRIVNIVGSVKFPGPYMLTGNTDRLSDLVRRAGGLTARAFPEGAEFVRNPALLETDRQKALQPLIHDTFRLVASDEYKRASALVDMDRLRIVFSQGASISSGGGGGVQQLLPTGGGGFDRGLTPGVSMDQALAAALRSEAVTNARTLTEKDLIPSGNLNVDMVSAVKRPNSKADPELLDGDVIVIPERPTTVSLSGAVALPSAVIFMPGQPIDYYLQRAGGVTHDADAEEIIVIRANGALIRYKRGVQIHLGDNILVPTKVMANRLKENANTVATITNAVTSAGVTLALLKFITGR